MPYGNGRAYRLDVRTRQFAPVETRLPATDYTWEAFGASNGRIYFGTYPNAYFGEYDPATGRCELWRQVALRTTYVTAFREELDGRIAFKAWGPDEVWLAFDPATRRIGPGHAPSGASGAPLPAVPKGDESWANSTAVGERRFAVSFPTSRLWELRPSKPAALRGIAGAQAEGWYLEATRSAVVGISHYGALFRYGLESGEFQRGKLDNEAPGGNGIMFIEAVTPRCIVGANYSQQNLFAVDPTTRRVRSSPSMIARVPGEPMCAVGANGKAYLGIYVRALISVYDPRRAFRLGQNPREIAELGTKYAQTRPRAAVTGRGLVFISSDGDYSRLGGALAVVDPRTDAVEVYHQLVPDQNLPTLVFDERTGLLWGGTDRWGQMRSHPPTQPSSLIYAFDPDTRKVVATLTPWPGSDVTSVLGVSREGILVASSGPEVALIDTTSRKVLFKGQVGSDIAPGALRRGADGASYFLSGGTLYRWDLHRNEIVPRAHSPGCTMLAEAEPGLWVLANATSVYRVRVPSQ